MLTLFCFLFPCERTLAFLFFLLATTKNVGKSSSFRTRNCSNFPRMFKHSRSTLIVTCVTVPSLPKKGVNRSVILLKLPKVKPFFHVLEHEKSRYQASHALRRNDSAARNYRDRTLRVATRALLFRTPPEIVSS